MIVVTFLIRRFVQPPTLPPKAVRIPIKSPGHIVAGYIRQHGLSGSVPGSGGAAPATAVALSGWSGQSARCANHVPSIRTLGVGLFRAVERKQATMFLPEYLSATGNSGRNIPHIPHFPRRSQGRRECGECRECFAPLVRLKRCLFRPILETQRAGARHPGTRAQWALGNPAVPAQRLRAKPP
jgi:hypothetical protein